MWYVLIKKDYVEFYLNNIKTVYPVNNCRSVDVNNEIIYFLSDTFVCAYKGERLLFNKATVENYCDKIVVKDYIYICGTDSGTLYKYDLCGNIIESIKIGEHISDFEIKENIYVLSYFDYKLTVLNDFKILKVIYFSNYPENIIVQDKIYLLMRNEFYSCIYMFDNNFTLLKKVKLKGQIAKLKNFNNKIIFDGDDERIVFNENLTILSNKKSTGINLCNFSNYPVCYKNMYLDIFNNVIYPL